MLYRVHLGVNASKLGIHSKVIILNRILIALFSLGFIWNCLYVFYKVDFKNNVDLIVLEINTFKDSLKKLLPKMITSFFLKIIEVLFFPLNFTRQIPVWSVPYSCCDKVCQRLTAGRWFPLGTPVFFKRLTAGRWFSLGTPVYLQRLSAGRWFSLGTPVFLQRLTAGRWFSLGTPVFLQLYNRPPRYNWNIVDSCVKHHHPNPIVIKLSMSFFNNGSRTDVYCTHHQHDQVKMKYNNINEYTSHYIENTNKKKTIMFYRSLFVLLYFFFLPLCCLFFFDILILITHLVFSNSSYTSAYN